MSRSRSGSTDLSAYSEQFQDTLQELAPPLNFTYQLVPDERRADIAAYVGISDEDARLLGFNNCDGFWGCTNIEIDETGEVVSGEIVIFQVNDLGLRQLGVINESIEYAMMHGMMQVMVPMGYRGRAGQRDEHRYRSAIPDDERVRPRNRADID